MTETLARCRGVGVVYGSGDSAVRALDGVDLDIEVAARLALLGRSGSGKTTLLHALGGLVRPTAGSIEWKGRPLQTLDEAARRAVRARGIAHVFQAANLLPHFSAFENVAFAWRIAGADPDALDPLALLELVGLSAKADSLPAELSGGESQRVALARALAQRPELLLCDEPTGHLDSDTGERMLDLIEAVQAEFGLALVIATHNPVVAERLGRSLEFRDGRIVCEAALA